MFATWLILCNFDVLFSAFPPEISTKSTIPQATNHLTCSKAHPASGRPLPCNPPNLISQIDKTVEGRSPNFSDKAFQKAHRLSAVPP
jgi:hypothetical protein